MGNTWKGVNDDRLIAAEQKILSYSGMPLEAFEVTNVIIDEEKNFVRTIQTGDVTCIIGFIMANRDLKKSW